ncbi:hypothetical protein OsI_30992 [Oryza sativa Indica Group]|uniref:Uncharacterized protein n=1 Tax=Oryza sativa subsp. indica TaxID=39946 RepID=A2Z062_ORYSI|nr:hypothetical protein OsI_30992 [Oryza sativa Indica Group]
MGAVEEEAEVLGEKVVELTTSINNILGSLQGLEKWIPCVDSGIRELNKAVDEIAVRVTQLEAVTPTTPSQAAQAPVGTASNRLTRVTHPKPSRLRSKPWSREELLGELSASKAQQKVIVKEGFKEASSQHMLPREYWGHILRKTRKERRNPSGKTYMNHSKLLGEQGVNASSVGRNGDLGTNVQSQFNCMC